MRWSVARVFAVLMGASGTLLAALACANPSLPPGGPPDAAPPRVLRVTPESGAVSPRPGEVVLQFDEVISETPKSAQDLRALVFISPKSGTPEVDWSRTRISIKPSKGWRPNTVYSIEIKPGIVDLQANAIDTTIRIVFSTGGAIPNTRISGAAFDWATARPAPLALVEAIAPDSTTYQTLADSSGRFELRAVPIGPYVLRAVLDRNANRELEPLEPWDTVSVTATESARADLYAFQHDTVGLRISEVSVQDSARVVRIVFDKPFAPGQEFTPERMLLTRADSTPIAVARVVTQGQRLLADSIRARRRADSLATRGDTSAAARARADSLAERRRIDSVANALRDARERERLAIARGERPRRDTLPPPRFARERVYSEIFLELPAPLPEASRFRVTVNGVRSLSGVVRSPSREFTTPRRTPADTGRRSP